VKIFGEPYDQILRVLDNGAHVCVIPIRGGVFRSVYRTASPAALSNAQSDPVRFAFVSCKSTRDYARDNGYEV
jgi:hypothetical protein